MTVAFALLFPLGMLIPRFSKSHCFKTILGDKWVWWHGGLLISGGLVAVIGLVLAVLMTPATHFAHSHGLVGMTLLGLVAFQILIGIFRPHKADNGDVGRVRYAWMVLHRTIGFTILCLSIAQVLTGISLKDQLLYDATAYIAVWFCLLGPILVFYVVAFILSRSGDSSARPLDAMEIQSKDSPPKNTSL